MKTDNIMGSPKQNNHPMPRIRTVLLMIAGLFWALEPTTRAFLLDFEDPPYSLGPLGSQDGWTSANGAVITTDNEGPSGGNSLRGGWNSTYPLDETYIDGIVYLSHYTYWNGDTASGNNAPSSWVFLLESSSGKRSHLSGRWSKGVPGILGSYGPLSSFTDAGWYFYDIEIDMDSKMLSAELTNLSTLESESFGPMGLTPLWGGGVPGTLDRLGVIHGTEGQTDRIAVGRERVAMVSIILPPPPTVPFTTVFLENVTVLGFRSTYGTTNIVQYTTSLATPEWTSIGTLIPGSGGEQLAFDLTGHSPNKTYRLVMGEIDDSSGSGEE